MSKTAKIIRSIVAGIMILIATLALALLITCIFDGALAVVIWGYFIFIHGIPVAVATIIYQVILIIKKKVWKFDLFASIYLLVVWLAQIISILVYAMFN